MKGNIYTSEKCPLCGGKMVNDENVRACVCPEHPHEKADRRFWVQFGGKRTGSRKRFQSYPEAYRYLVGLRFKYDEGTYDPRDYHASMPLALGKLVETWLGIKQKSVKPNTYRNIRREINRAVDVWGNRNIKSIHASEIEDFLYSFDVSEKSRANISSVLHDFFHWACGRLEVVPPRFPEIKFVLGWRNIVSLEDQGRVLDEIKAISWDVNPKIWLGIKWLATYISIRPNEMRMLEERHIDVNGLMVVTDSKENKPKLIPMLDEDIELYRSMPRGFPKMYFFRHIKGNGAAEKGSQFGKDYWWKWAKKAMHRLRIDGVDLYGLTKHSTVTALGEVYSKQELMDFGSFHSSNKAFLRYMQAQKDRSKQIYRTADEMRGKVVPMRKAGGEE